MVGNVAKLTRSLRNSFIRNEARSDSSPAVSAAMRTLIHQELRRTGEAIYVDDRGNRFRIEVAKPVQ